MIRAFGEWINWAIEDEKTGFCAGVRDDAPEGIKKQYKEYLKSVNEGL
ncbi:MAG TPA: hypothetical protein O0X39_01270 [Methanocorpusculum sp.]|nr:hypothetical protein [Methanocorpusculum sp.]